MLTETNRCVVGLVEAATTRAARRRAEHLHELAAAHGLVLLPVSSHTHTHTHTHEGVKGRDTRHKDQ
jgi:hypothetical protein